MVVESLDDERSRRSDEGRREHERIGKVGGGGSGSFSRGESGVYSET